MITRRLMMAASLAAFAAACSPEPKAAKGRGKAIRFATDWRAQGEHGGFYQALASGEYAKRGLDVTIMQGGPSVNVPQLLASGAIDLGVGSNSFIPMNMAAEKVPVKAVAAFFQKDPQVLIAHPDTGVARIADMRDRPILLADASKTAFWVWLKARYGFTDAQVRSYNYSLAPFLADKQAIVQGYLSSEPFQVEKEGGFKPAVFLLADEGYPGYATMLLAPDRLIAQDPETIRAFIEASAAGWKAYLHGDPAAADALILKDNPEMTAALLANAREQLRSHGIIESGDAAAGNVGAMSEARWAEFFRVTSEQGVYPRDLDYHRAFTLDFVKAKA